MFGWFKKLFPQALMMGHRDIRGVSLKVLLVSGEVDLKKERTSTVRSLYFQILKKSEPSSSLS